MLDNKREPLVFDARRDWVQRSNMLECSSNLTIAERDMSHTASEFADDLLRGDIQIAEFLFGPMASRRKVYYLARYTRIPLFRIGSVLCGRRSVLRGWVEAQEQKTALGADRAG